MSDDEDEMSLEEFLRTFEHEQWCEGNSDLDEDAGTWPGHDTNGLHGYWECVPPEHMSWCQDPDNDDLHDQDGCNLVALQDEDGDPTVTMMGIPADTLRVVVDATLVDEADFDALIKTLVDLKPVCLTSRVQDIERYE